MMEAGKCKHFTGIQHGACDAGVNYKSTIPGGLPLYRNLPCFRQGAGKCERFEEPTAEEIAKDKAEIDRVIAAVVAGKSPCCGADLTPAKPDGTGARFCTSCKAFVVRGCRPSEAPEP